MTSSKTAPPKSPRGVRFELARVSIEATTPLLVGQGEGDDLSDAIAVADANGIPAIPGSSLAGILRHALAAGDDPDHHKVCRQAFGFQEGNRGESSRVELSWAQAHNAQNQPVPMIGAEWDEVTAAMATGIVRDHVRIDAYGVAGHRGKYDERVVPTGARFSFELLVHEGAGVKASDLIRLLMSPSLRLGGRTRRGLGSFRVISAFGRSFDLTQERDRTAWRQLPRALETKVPPEVGLKKIEVSADTPKNFRRIQLELQPLDYWIVGRGEGFAHGHRHQDRDHDMIPLSEKRILWTSTGGSFLDHRSYLVPGSGIKGALRHRTAYHVRRQAHDFTRTPPAQTLEDPVEVQLLFGQIRAGDHGSPGHVFVEDVLVDCKSKSGVLHHVSIDRFSGGPLDGHLFSEAPLWKGNLTVPIDIDIRPRRREEDREVFNRALRAFRAALFDLCEGRLALGAGANRGHGYCSGSLKGLDDLKIQEADR